MRRPTKSPFRGCLIGLFFDDPRQLVQAANDQGRITHLDPRSSAGPVAGAVFLALRYGSFDKPAFVSQMRQGT